LWTVLKTLCAFVHLAMKNHLMLTLKKVEKLLTVKFLAAGLEVMDGVAFAAGVTSIRIVGHN